MRATIFVYALPALILAGIHLAQAQQAAKVARVAVLLNPRNTSSADRWKEAEAVGQLLRVRLQAVEVRSTEDFEKAFKVVTRESAHALMVLRAPIIDTHRRRVIN